jgi:hypothetical protein
MNSLVNKIVRVVALLAVHPLTPKKISETRVSILELFLFCKQK